MVQETNVFVGKGSIEKSLLLSKSEGRASSVSNVSGRSLLRAAKDVLCNCKKLTAIVTASNSPYKDGNYPSGTNWDDYIYWCLAAMKKAVVEKAVGGETSTVVAEKHAVVRTQRVVGDAAAGNTGDRLALPPNAVTEDSNNELPVNKKELATINKPPAAGDMMSFGNEEPDGTFSKVSWLGAYGAIFQSLQMMPI